MGDQHCFDSNLNFSYLDHSRYFRHGIESLVKDPVPYSVVNLAGTLGIRDTPKIPWYLMETVSDDASPIELTDKVYNKFCKQGASILVCATLPNSVGLF
jgi:hypothetical protein